MSQEVYSQYSFPCKANDIDVYLEYNNSILYNTRKKIIEEEGLQQYTCRELILITKCEVEQYNGLDEVRRLCRGNVLVIQGIISFFTSFPLTMYNAVESKVGIVPIKYKVQSNHLFIQGKDYTYDLIQLLRKINEESKLIISLLDRWRKAIYLKEQSDADLYYDEAFLSFFHILELFGNSIKKDLKKKLDTSIVDLLSNYYRAYYFSKDTIKEMVQQNKKPISSILISDDLSLAIKIKYFLEKYDMLDDNTAFFVDNMIEIRNDIAHGRITYKNKFVYPLSPFFNLAKDSYENMQFLFFLTARMISKYIGITCWEQEWEESKKYLLPPKSTLDLFLNDDSKIYNFDEKMLLEGNKYNITWRTIFNHYIKKPKKDFLDKLEIKLKNYFMKVEMNEENSADLFNISLLFSDSIDDQIKNKAIENIKIAISKQWYGWSNFKDAYSYLEFYNVNLIWYKSFLMSESHNLFSKDE
ncbi:MAG: hypothetical protein FWC47_03710 [Oscillospiraceae bacterium]|nr:hypothetical protein [Oscillospiraceae bacterium]